jgi:hypothetical protein
MMATPTTSYAWSVMAPANKPQEPVIAAAAETLGGQVACISFRCDACFDARF